MIYFICTSFSLPSTLECPKSILAPHDHRSREKQILQFNKVHKGIRISNQSYNLLLITLLGESYLALYCLCFPKFSYEQMFWKHTGIILVMIFENISFQKSVACNIKRTMQPKPCILHEVQGNMQSCIEGTYVICTT